MDQTESEHFLWRKSFWPWLRRKYCLRLQRLRDMNGTYQIAAGYTGTLDGETILRMKKLEGDYVQVATEQRTVVLDAPYDILLYSIGLYTLETASSKIMDALRRARASKNV